MRKQRNKLKLQDYIKIKRRYDMITEKYSDKSLEELKEIYNTTKMSTTDKSAIVALVDIKLKEKVVKESKNPEEFEDGNGY